MYVNKIIITFNKPFFLCHYLICLNVTIQGLSELHSKAKKHFKSSQYESTSAGHDDIIERISQLEIAAHENARDGKLSNLDNKVYDSDTFILDLVQ